MPSPYEKERNILGIGNACFAPTGTPLTIPRRVRWGVHDITQGRSIVFREQDETGQIREYTGLEKFIEITHPDQKIVVCDNHNHALYFWYEALWSGQIQPGAQLIHIDEHSDLWENTQSLPPLGTESPEAIDEFVQWCEVGNYILPAMRNGLIGNIVRYENEYELDRATSFITDENSILNIDIDIFSPELDFISFEKKWAAITHFLPLCPVITIATSPFFIDQEYAITLTQKILTHHLLASVDRVHQGA